jgi:hypothetical protein
MRIELIAERFSFGTSVMMLDTRFLQKYQPPVFNLKLPLRCAVHPAFVNRDAARAQRNIAKPEFRNLFKSS